MSKWVYRIESKTPDNGLWYNARNEKVWGIGKIEGSKTKDLPMDYDCRYHKDGKNWFSSCSQKEDMTNWFSQQDTKELLANGFVITKYLVVDYVEYDKETVFLKETALARVEIDIDELFDSRR